MYLEEPEEGGATFFPQAGLEIPIRKVIKIIIIIISIFFFFLKKFILLIREMHYYFGIINLIILQMIEVYMEVNLLLKELNLH